MTPQDMSRQIDTADDFRKTVLTARTRLKDAERVAYDVATNHSTALQNLDSAVLRLQELKSGRGRLLAETSDARIYEFWLEFPGYSGISKGATARLTQHGAIRHFRDVESQTKGGLGGAVVGGLLFGPVGAVVGVVARRKTTVKTNERTVDNRKFELELSASGFCWSTITGPEEENDFQDFCDIVNARGINSDDIKILIVEQESLLRHQQEIVGPAEDALKSANKIVQQEKGTYDAAWAYAAIRLPLLLDLQARWTRNMLPILLVAIVIGPGLLLCGIFLGATIYFLQTAILIGAAVFYFAKVRLMK